jgi:tRNA-dihydrouridine synthase A
MERAGADALIVHARKAWLKGLSPKENREVPPLDYDRVYRLKTAHPRLTIVLNGGIGSLAEVAAHLDRVDGVMMGRAAYQQPWRLLAVDACVFDDAPPFASPRAAAAALIPYMERELASGVRLHAITRHMHGLFQGVPGARAFRRRLAEAGASPRAGTALLREALALVADDVIASDRAAA